MSVPTIIGIVAHRTIEIPTAACLIKVLRETDKYDVIFRWNQARVSKLRGKVAYFFLTEFPESSTLVFLDTDMTFQPEALEGLVKVTRPQEVRWVGAGFMAIPRPLLEDLVSREDLIDEHDDPWHPVFEEVRVGSDRGTSSLWDDYAFCERALRAGYKVYVLPNHQLGHFGLYEYQISPTKGYER
jgi:hypothetical protein